MNQRRTGIVLNYVSKAIQILTGLFYTPIMLQSLGQSEYGTYQLVYSVISYLSILNLGMTGAYNRFYYRYKVKKEEENIAKLNWLFLSVFIAISLVSTLCGVFMYQNIEIILGGKLLGEEIRLAKHLMIYMIFNIAITFPANVFDCNVAANESFIFQKLLIIFQGLVGPFVTLPLLFRGYGSVGVVLVTTVLTVLKFIVNVVYCIKRLEMKFRIGRIDWNLLVEILHFSFFIVVSQVVEIINCNVDNFLLGRYMGVIPIAVYGVASQINSLYMQLSTAVSSIFSPQVNQIVARTNDNLELDNLFIKVGRIQFIVLLLVLLEFVLVGESFIVLWVGEEYRESFWITLALIIPVTIPLIQNIGVEIQYAKNMHKVRAFVYLMISIFNVIISIGFIKCWGAFGAALGTALALLLGNVLFMNYYYHKKIGLNIKKFWISIGEFVPTIILTYLMGKVVNKIVPISSWLDFGINASIIGIVYLVVMYLISCNEYEKDLVKSLAKGIVKKV